MQISVHSRAMWHKTAKLEVRSIYCPLLSDQVIGIVKYCLRKLCQKAARKALRRNII